MSKNTFEISGQATFANCVNWQPTVKLRFVFREVILDNDLMPSKVRVLQQLWADMCSQDKDWRDVPVEDERNV